MLSYTNLIEWCVYTFSLFNDIVLGTDIILHYSSHWIWCDTERMLQRGSICVIDNCTHFKCTEHYNV